MHTVCFKVFWEFKKPFAINDDLLSTFTLLFSSISWFDSSDTLVNILGFLSSTKFSDFIFLGSLVTITLATSWFISCVTLLITSAFVSIFDFISFISTLISSLELPSLGILDTSFLISSTASFIVSVFVSTFDFISSTFDSTFTLTFHCHSG